MVENNDLKSENTMNSANVKLIIDKKKLLEETTHTIQEEIRSSFEHLIGALKSREKQLLRQVEAVHVQQLSLIQSNLESVPCKPLLTIDLGSRYDLESQILRLGKLEVFGKNGISVKDAEPYRVQEYQDADKDHESFNKSIKLTEVGEADLSIAESNADSSCLCNSSAESEKSSALSVSICTIIEREIVSDNETLAKSDNELGSPYRIGFSLDVRNENLKELSSKEETCFSEELVNSNFIKDINANKEQDRGNSASKSRQMRRDSGEHPKQIQQWLKQILVETETEPMIHEIEQFSEISKARLSGQFPLET